MKGLAHVALFGFGCLWVAVVWADARSLKDLRGYFADLQDGPYTLLDAPRTGLGIGTTYVIVKGQTLYYTRPEECFTPKLLKKITGNLAVPTNGAVSANLAWDVGLRMAGVGPITSSLAADAGFKDVRTVNFQMSELSRQLLTIAEVKNAFDDATDRACLSALQNRTPVRYLVLETLSARSMSVTFKDADGKNASLSVGLLSKIFPKFNFGAAKDWAGTLSFKDDPHIVAIKSVTVPEALAFAGGDTELVVVKPDLFYSR